MLYFIPTPIGNLADISLRALDILKTCQTIICEDTRVCKSLFHLLNSKFNLNLKPKRFLALHSHNEQEFLQYIDDDFFNFNVAYLSDAGMPGISDPGVFLVRLAQEKGIAYEVLSGANAALIALVASGFCDKEFIFLGFLNNTGKQRQKDLEKALNNPYPSIIYEAPKRILSLIKAIATLEESRELFLIKEISKKFEKKFKNTAKSLVNQLENENLNGEWVLVIKPNKEESENKNLLCEADILELDLPLKTKSKLLAKMKGKNAKELYHLLLSQNKVLL